MKAIINLFLLSSLLIIICFMLCTSKVSALTTDDGYEYKFAGDEVTITSYTGDDRDIVIPSSIDGKKVIRIGEGAFSKCKASRVVVPNRVKYILGDAFYNCDQLKSIELPKSLKSIGGLSFYDCDSLTSIEIPGGVKDINFRTFYDCDSLKSVTIPQSVESIMDEAFYCCNSLTDLKIGGAKIIYDSAFCKCESLTRVELPKNLMNIRYAAFAGCSKLSDVVFQSDLYYIQNNAFSGCVLNEVRIPSSVVDIGHNAFANFSGTIYVPSNIDYIDGGAFVTQNDGVVYAVKGSKADEVAKKHNTNVSYYKESRIRSPKVTKAKRTKNSKKAIIKWKNVPGAKGYEILNETYYSGSISPSRYVVSTKKTSKKIEYETNVRVSYVRVRAYKIVNGVKEYGKFSKIKEIS